MINSSLSDTAVFDIRQPEKPAVVEGTLKLNATKELLEGSPPRIFSELEKHLTDPSLVRIEISFADVRSVITKDEVCFVAIKLFPWVNKHKGAPESNPRSVSFVDISPEISQDLKIKRLDKFITLAEVPVEKPAAPTESPKHPVHQTTAEQTYQGVRTPKVGLRVSLEGSTAVIHSDNPCPRKEDLETALSGLGNGLKSIRMDLRTGGSAVEYAKYLPPLLVGRLAKDGELTVRLEASESDRIGRSVWSTISVRENTASVKIAGRELTVSDINMAGSVVGSGKEIIEVDLTSCSRIRGTEATLLAIWGKQLAAEGKLIITFDQNSSVREGFASIPASMMKKVELHPVQLSM